MQVCVDCGTTNDVATSTSDKQLRCTPCHVAFMDKPEVDLAQAVTLDPCTECIHYMRDHKHLDNWIMQCTVCDCRYDANRTATVLTVKDNLMKTCEDCGTTEGNIGQVMMADGRARCTPCLSKHIANLGLTPNDDPVSRPAHYTSDPSGIECIQITRHRNFNIGNAIKYLWRAGLKNPASVRAQTEDLKKAIWYINDEIERLQTK